MDFKLIIKYMTLLALLVFILGLIILNYNLIFVIVVLTISIAAVLLCIKNESSENLENKDSLTSIVDRNTLLNKLNEFVNLEKNENKIFAFVTIDLDNFKAINNSLGHHAGDLLLKKVANIINNNISSEDVLGRIGSDEFAILIKNTTSADVINIAAKIDNELQQGVNIWDEHTYVNASFAIAIYPEHGENTLDLLKCSDIAMHKAKQPSENNIQIFHKSLEKVFLRKIEIESLMAKALKHNEMYLVFQPQYKLNCKKLMGFEALLRWDSSKLGMIEPKEFIPLAENSGFIIRIGEWVIRESCKFIKSVKDKYGYPVFLTVNISSIQIMDSKFIDRVDKIINEMEINPGELEFEITETVLLKNPDAAIKILKNLKDLGIKIALDDFGTGYSSFKYLQVLPIDTVKLDKIFSDAIISKAENMQIIGSLIELMHKIGLMVVAEGVEVEDQLSYLRIKECDIIQGFIWGTPLPYNEAIQVMKNENIKYEQNL